ncbi:SPRY domain-containing protein [Umbelopsis sp. PMI_123]|nr:SPRY domain-containing protein [Umbelopsis sp. PMI_123]
MQPPTYDYVAHASNSHDAGLYHDASTDSYHRAEAFITNNLHGINQPPPEPLCRDILSGGLINYQNLDLSQSTKDLVLVEPSNTATFHPRKGSRLNKFMSRSSASGDTDVSIQALYPMLGTAQLKSLANIKTQVDSEPPQYGDEVHYFEVTILETSSNITMAIGLCTRPYPSFRLPGWNRYSIGWHSDDGRKFCDDPDGGQDFTEPWGKAGDVLGCGWDTDHGNVWFTRNGVIVGTAYSDLSKHVFFPAFGADGYCKVKFNFGKAPFNYRFLPFQRWIGLYTVPV